MQFSIHVFVWVTFITCHHAVHCFVLPRSTANCSTFEKFLQQSLGGLNTTVTSTVLIAANSSSNVHDYCQVVGSVAYTSNDSLHFEVWLPDAEAYTGRFMAVGTLNTFLCRTSNLRDQQVMVEWPVLLIPETCYYSSTWGSLLRGIVSSRLPNPYNVSDSFTVAIRDTLL